LHRVVSNLVYYYPHFMAVVFLIFFLSIDYRNKGSFIWRALLALTVATFLAHVNRIFHIWPAYLLFPSGHMTFCLGVSISLGMLRRWTLAFSLPLLIPFGAVLVIGHFRGLLDLAAATLGSSRQPHKFALGSRPCSLASRPRATRA
jgi:hypothetical protein